LTKLQQHLYAAGNFGVSFMGYVLTQWVMKFYFPDSLTAHNLVPAALAPWIMFTGRVTDGIGDPLEGYFSDRLRTRWGRRKPFMIVGMPLLCLLFMLLWYPPATRESVANFWYATLLLVVFFVAFSIYVGPYLAMLPEITRTDEERVALSGLQGIYNVVGLIAAAFASGAMLNAGLGYRGMAWVVMIASLVAYVLPFFGPTDDPRRVADQPTPPFFRSVAMSLSNRPFLIYTCSRLLFMFGLLLIVAALPYMAETLLHVPEGEAGMLSGIALLSGVLCVPLIMGLAKRRGMKRAYLFSMGWFTATTPLLALMAVVGGHDWGVWAMRGLMLVTGVAIGGLFALPSAILSTITDFDKAHTGMDRQGMYFCVEGLILKAAYSGAPAAVTGLLALLPEHRFLVLSLIGPITALTALMANVIFRRFPEEEVKRAVAAAQA
jgi:GPH family glycoside/pentoside/hexuronide:cation symporter